MLPAVPVAGTLAVAGLLLTVGRWLPRRAPDILATIVCLLVAGLCVVMVREAASGPLVYWFGGWIPRPTVTIGIGFAVDQAGAMIGAFIAILFALALIFAWGFFDAVHEHFHVLMLLFMAGMIGFCFTHDLFNMFVWFELMSVAGFALTAYALSSSALEGALNFTIVNTIGAYLILAGIGLVYARAGALDFTAISLALRSRGDDPVALAGFALLASGLLIKAAQVPFHFWLADAHAVAPSPVSVIFSGAMVSLGIFGVGRLLWPIFANSPGVHHAAHALLLAMGAASVVVGGAMALLQRHIKRMLAFSTISHVGIMLLGLAVLNRSGLAGMLTYLVGHGLVKGALFMMAGILLSRSGGIDEINLRGRGKGHWPAAITMGFGGLLLGGLPLGMMDAGAALIARTCPLAVVAAMALGTACTGAALLRATGRIFLGWGECDGEEGAAPTEDERERADRPLWLMLSPAVVLLALSMPGIGSLAQAAAFQFSAGAAPLTATIERPWLGWISVGGALLIAAYQLFRAQLGQPIRRLGGAATTPISTVLEAVHSGIVGDYVMWLVFGLVAFAVVLAT